MKHRQRISTPASRVLPATVGIALTCALLAPAAPAWGDAYVTVTLDALTFSPALESPAPNRLRATGRDWSRAFVRLDAGEGYLALSPRPWEPDVDPPRIACRAEDARAVSGALFVWSDGEKRFTRHRFTAEASPEAGGETIFHRAKQAHYESLLRREIPGAAWFRHVADAAGEAAGGTPADTTGEAPRVGRPTLREQGDLLDTYELFSGGRALSENLQLDRLLPPVAGGEATVDVSAIEGITLEAFDWDSLAAGFDPVRDPLAYHVPADQHAVFFPDFPAFVRLLDELETHAFPLLEVSSPRGEAFHTLERYEAQLGVTLDGLAREVAGLTVRSVAVTGSDPYLVAGTDVALLLETRVPDALLAFVDAAYESVRSRERTVEAVTGRAGAIDYRGVVAPDRRVSSYVAALEGAVVLTNSIPQLERLAEPRASGASLAASAEYAFFRDRYPAGGGETAFLILTDATIRRWCGPRVRIAGSRRTRALGLIADATARHADAIVAGRAAGSVPTGRDVLGAGELHLTPRGVRSEIYGDVTFSTPIAEIPLEKVSQHEEAAYAAWRDRYQQRWRRVFDPIAASIRVGDVGIAVDVSVVPLIEGSDYRGIMNVTRGSAIAPDAGDRHADAVLHLALALDVESGPLRNAGGFARAFAPGSGPAFGWLGTSVSLFVDDDAYWEEMAAGGRPERFVRDTWHRLPIAVNAEVDDPLALTVFLAGMRGFIEQTAPGLTVWEPLEHVGQAYVRVSAAQPLGGRVPEGFSIFYAVTPESFVLTPSETVLIRALERQSVRLAARERGEPPPEQGEPWLGENIALRVTTRLVDILEQATVSFARDALRRTSWDNLPILNEWRRRYPAEDPVEVHRRLYGVELICSGGGRYVWDDEWGTMTSTAYGHPAAPEEGPPASLAIFSTLASGRFGLTFGENDLRARAVLTRAGER